MSDGREKKKTSKVQEMAPGVNPSVALANFAAQAPDLKGFMLVFLPAEAGNPVTWMCGPLTNAELVFMADLLQHETKAAAFGYDAGEIYMATEPEETN